MGYLAPLTYVSKYFTVGDLSKTNQPVSNAVPDEYLPALKTLGTLLDELYDRIGPFELISGFRSYDLQERLNPAPHEKGTKSFHEIGQAVDIVPDMDLREYFSKMLNDASIRYAFADISYKPWDGSLHLEAPERANASGRARIKEIGGAYRELSLAEITDYMNNPQGFEAANIVKKAAVPLGLGVLALGVGLFALSMSRK